MYSGYRDPGSGDLFWSLGFGCCQFGIVKGVGRALASNTPCSQNQCALEVGEVFDPAITASYNKDKNMSISFPIRAQTELKYHSWESYPFTPDTAMAWLEGDVYLQHTPGGSVPFVATYET